MPPKAAAAPKKASGHASYQDMITDAIVNLKDRKGSSRQSLKKYVKANNALNVTDNMFDSLFNKALKAGVDKGTAEKPEKPETALTKTKAGRVTKTTKAAPAKKAAAPKKAAPKKAAAAAAKA
ncbi:hypothetical protein HYE68_010599 [Fusarium pseudograminearum]|nr:hypothetical protein HYE68_010599 [Fusarium pseudograminearum]